MFSLFIFLLKESTRDEKEVKSIYLKKEKKRYRTVKYVMRRGEMISSSIPSLLLFSYKEQMSRLKRKARHDAISKDADPTYQIGISNSNRFAGEKKVIVIDDEEEEPSNLKQEMPALEPPSSHVVPLPPPPQKNLPPPPSSSENAPSD